MGDEGVEHGLVACLLLALGHCGLDGSYEGGVLGRVLRSRRRWPLRHDDRGERDIAAGLEGVRRRSGLDRAEELAHLLEVGRQVPLAVMVLAHVIVLLANVGARAHPQLQGGDDFDLRLLGGLA